MSTSDPGDTISLPTKTFRGFTNIGDDTGFLWAVLGGDDPGRVLWAPQVFDMAKDYGLVLLETGRLVDTAAGETVPPDARPMPPTSVAQVAALTRYNDAEAAALVARDRPGHGETPVIGPDGPIAWPHDFTLDRLDLAVDEAGDDGTPPGVEVVFVHRGRLDVRWPGGCVDLGEGDTMSVPTGLTRRFSSRGGATAFIARGPGRTG